MLAAIAFAALLGAETRHHRPLLDFGLFRDRNFALACMLAFLLMFDIMALLLYYNLFAQAPDGLGMTAGCRRPFAHAALGRAVRLRAGGAPARGRGRHAADDGGRVAAAGARLRDCLGRLGVLAGAGFAVLMARPFRGRRRHRIALRFGPEDRPRGAVGDADRKGLGHPQLVQLSRRNRRRHGGGIVFGVAGFEGVLVLVGLSALVRRGLSLRLRSAG